MTHCLNQLSLVVLCACVLLGACKPEAPAASDAQLARAERIYTECVEDELGLELEQLRLSPTGDIFVKFAAGTSDRDAARALQICEPRIAFVLEPGSADLLGPPANLGRPAADKELRSLVTRSAKRGFEGVVLVEQAGRRRLTSGVGKLRAGSARAPDSNTAFDCGSIMKEVTAALIFLLEQDGIVSRTATLGALFPDAPSVWRAITLDQVLRHRAGFHEYHDTDGDFEPMDRDQAQAAIFAQEPLFEAGSASAYSNSGYTLLAIVLEQQSGSDYRSLARKRIFEPLAMRRTGFYGDALWSDANVAIGRSADQFGDNNPAHWPAPSWALMGNGGLVSTAEDLLHMAKAFDADTLLPTAARSAFWQLQSPGSIDGRAWFGYAGGNDFGFDVVVAQVPSDQSYIIVASHVLSAVSPEMLGVGLLQSMYGAVAELPQQD
jgi:CubicO group peptidase (beta-lactamase class C family)